MIKKRIFLYICSCICIVFAGCNDNTYRYFCQNPENFDKDICQKPRCEFDQDCPEYLVAPILEKKIEGTSSSIPQQSIPATNCR
jgi:hypothetical protein